MGRFHQKMNTMTTIFIGFTIIFISCVVLMAEWSDKRPLKSLEISATLYAQPPRYLIEGNKRLADLYTIAIALDKFKNDHRHYPITLSQGNGWFSIYTNGQKNTNWIVGLAPTYLKALPYDERNSKNKWEQYAYQSDGANYKLISFYPPDCIDVYKIYPKLAVTQNADCVGYGLWTKSTDWNSLL